MPARSCTHRHPGLPRTRTGCRTRRSHSLWRHGCRRRPAHLELAAQSHVRPALLLRSTDDRSSHRARNLPAGGHCRGGPHRGRPLHSRRRVPRHRHGFAAIARVTDSRWIACSVKDDIQFGLQPGSELRIESTICNEIRQHGKAVAIDNVAEDDTWRAHATPAMYGFGSLPLDAHLPAQRQVLRHAVRDRSPSHAGQHTGGAGYPAGPSPS